MSVVQLCLLMLCVLTIDVFVCTIFVCMCEEDVASVVSCVSVSCEMM